MAATVVIGRARVAATAAGAQAQVIIGRARVQADAAATTSDTTFITITDTLGVSDTGGGDEQVATGETLTETLGLTDTVTSRLQVPQVAWARSIRYGNEWRPSKKRIWKSGSWRDAITLFYPFAQAPLEQMTGWGSSSIFGAGGDGRTIMTWLAEDFAVSTFNAAGSGEFSGHAAWRMNAVKATLTLSGNSIPASGAATVTAHNAGTNAGNAASVIEGTLKGVPGRLTWAANVWSFTRTTAGSAVPIAAGEVFTAKWGQDHSADTQVFHIGKNNAVLGTDTDVTKAISDMAAMWAAVKTSPRRAVVLNHWNNGNMASGAARTRVGNLNAAYAAAYGTYYVDVASYLYSAQVWADTGIKATAADLSAQAAGMLPDSLSSDPVSGGGIAQHLNSAGYRAVAQLVADKMISLGWYGLPALPATLVGLDFDLHPGADNALMTSMSPAAASLESTPLTASTAQAPTLKKNILNGHAVARFAGAQRMSTAAWSTTRATPHTVVSVWRRTTPVTGNVYTGVNTTYVYAGASGAALVAGAGATLQMSYPPPVEDWFLEVVVYNGAESRMYVNSITPVLLGTTGGTAAAGLSGFTIGSNGTGTTNFLTGDEAYVWVYNGALPQSQVANIVRQLRTKYFGAPVVSGGLGTGALGTSPLGGTGGGPVTNPNAMPLTNPAGYTRVFADDFLYDFAEGTITPNSSANLVTGPAAATVGAKFTFYPDTWATTHNAKVYPILSTEPGYIQPGQPGYPAQYPPINSRYYPSKVLSFSSTTSDGTATGVMRIRQHSEVLSGVETALGAAIKPKHPSGSYMTGPYGRYAFRMRVKSAVVNGVDYAATNNFTTSPNLNHIHVPLAIDSNNWPQNGEFNHPDGDVNRRIKGTYHPAAAQNESWSYQPEPAMSPFQWHTYEVIWEPGRARFLIDGVAIKDTTDRVPTMQMAMVIFQHEANWRQPIGEAVTEIDWVVMWDYTP